MHEVPLTHTATTLMPARMLTGMISPKASTTVTDNTMAVIGSVSLSIKIGSACTILTE